MENFKKEILLQEIKTLQEQVRVLRKEKEELLLRVNNLEEAINMILHNEGMVDYGE